jgi:hypothetical protein
MACKLCAVILNLPLDPSSFFTVLFSYPSVLRAGSGNLNSQDKWNFCLTSA